MMALTQHTKAEAPHWTQLAGNALLFQGLWFSAVLGYEALAIGVVAIMLVHAVYMQWLQTHWRALGVIAVLGMCTDSAFAYFGAYAFPFTPQSWPLPVWLTCLWLGFVITLPASLAWLLRHWLVSVVAFSVAGSLSYMAGRALGALEFDNSALLATASLWAIIGALSAGLLGGPAPRKEA